MIVMSGFHFSVVSTVLRGGDTLGFFFQRVGHHIGVLLHELLHHAFEQRADERNFERVVQRTYQSEEAAAYAYAGLRIRH